MLAIARYHRNSQRLERHRLPVPGRQVRADLRGPRGRHRPGRGRRAGAGLEQHVDRHRLPRRLHLDRPDARGHGRARAPDRLEAVRPRRPDRGRGDRRLGGRRDQPLPGRDAGHLPAHLRPPRRQQHELPGQRALRPARRSCGPPPPSTRARPRGSRSTRRRRCAASSRSTISGSLRFPDGSSADGRRARRRVPAGRAGAAWRSVATAVAGADGSWRTGAELPGSGSLRASSPATRTRGQLASPPRNDHRAGPAQPQAQPQPVPARQPRARARDRRPGHPGAAHARRAQPAPLGAARAPACCACGAAPTRPSCARAGAGSTA